jgi:hypothetical protein
MALRRRLPVLPRSRYPQSAPGLVGSVELRVLYLLTPVEPLAIIHGRSIRDGLTDPRPTDSFVASATVVKFAVAPYR